eukprot:gene6154-7664_t
MIHLKNQTQWVKYLSKSSLLESTAISNISLLNNNKNQSTSTTKSPSYSTSFFNSSKNLQQQQSSSSSSSQNNQNKSTLFSSKELKNLENELLSKTFVWNDSLTSSHSSLVDFDDETHVQQKKQQITFDFTPSQSQLTYINSQFENEAMLGLDPQPSSLQQQQQQQQPNPQILLNLPVPKLDYSQSLFTDEHKKAKNIRWGNKNPFENKKLTAIEYSDFDSRGSSTEKVTTQQIRYLFNQTPKKANDKLIDSLANETLSVSEVDEIYDWVKNTKHFLNVNVVNTFLRYYGSIHDVRTFSNILNRFLSNEIEMNTESYQIVFDFWNDREETFTLKSWLKRFSYSNCIDRPRPLVLSLIKSYLNVGEEDEALNTFYNIDSINNKDMGTISETLSILLNHFAQKGEYEKAIQLFQQYIKSAPNTLTSERFTRFYELLWEGGVQVGRIIDFLEQERMVSPIHFHQWIVYYLDNGRRDISQSIYELYLQRYKPTFSVFNSFIRNALIEENIEEIKSLVKQIHHEGLFTDTTIDFNAMQLCERKNDLESLDFMITHMFFNGYAGKKVSHILAYCKINQHNEIYQRIEQRMMKSDFPKEMSSIICNQMIRDFLKLDRYDLALGIYSDRLTKFKLLPNRWTIDFFILYHQLIIESAAKGKRVPASDLEWHNKLLKDWETRRSLFKVRESISHIIKESYVNLNPRSALDSIDRFTPSGILKAHYNKPSSTISLNHLKKIERADRYLKERSVLDDSVDYILDQCIESRDIEGIFTQLEGYFENDQIPHGYTLPKIALLFLEYDPKSYLRLVQASPISFRTIIFNPDFYGKLLREDLNFGVNTLKLEDPLLWRKNDNIWDSTIIGLLNYGRLEMAGKAINTATVLKKVLNTSKIQEHIDNPGPYQELNSDVEEFISSNFHFNFHLKKHDFAPNYQSLSSPTSEGDAIPLDNNNDDNQSDSLQFRPMNSLNYFGKRYENNNSRGFAIKFTNPQNVDNNNNNNNNNNKNIHINNHNNLNNDLAEDLDFEKKTKSKLLKHKFKFTPKYIDLDF